MERGYNTAIRLLRSRAKRPKKLGIPNNYFMKDWLIQLGYTDPDVLKIIHITGTKGKGSTASFTESLLRNHFNRLAVPFRTGLYTSPHVVEERDRIRIDFEPVSEDVFANAFSYIWERLGLDLEGTDEEYKPGYLQFLTLLSVHIFIQEKVDVAIYEVHAGGRKDATNIFDTPIACGITEIGLDHADILGPDIRSIVWHKSGIMKHGRPVYSVVQSTSTAKMLDQAANDIGCRIDYVDALESLPEHPNIGQVVQKRNFALAKKLAGKYLSDVDHSLRPGDENVAVQIALPCRFHLKKGRVEWCLDSAHNHLSLPTAVSWFQSVTRADKSPEIKSFQQILIFGHSSHRNTEELIDVVIDNCRKLDVQFDHLILSAYHRYDDRIPDSIVERQLEFWRSRQPEKRIAQASAAGEAISIVMNMQKEYPNTYFKVLVTGSAHLIGEAVRVLGSQWNLLPGRDGLE